MLVDSEISALRRELAAYLQRLVIIPQLAEDLAQESFVRALGAVGKVPTDRKGYRRWIFRIATNLAIDALRQRRRRNELNVLDLREAAESDPAFVARSKALVGTPETAAIASEHLVACFACSLTNLPEQQAAALLLTEVHDFSVAETADALGISTNRAKNAIQSARRVMVKKYESTCALVTKQGVCHQCDELSDFFGASRVTIDSETDRWEARLRVLRDMSSRAPGVWHTLLFGRARAPKHRQAGLQDDSEK